MLFMSSVDFSKLTSSNNFSEIPSECQTVWTLIRRFVGPDLGPNCLSRLSADDTDRQKVKQESGKSI